MQYYSIAVGKFLSIGVGIKKYNPESSAIKLFPPMKTADNFIFPLGNN